MQLDFSAVDRAVEKVIAKHEILSQIERVAREKVDSDLHPLFVVASATSKAVRLAQLAAKYTQLMSANANNCDTSKAVKVFAVGQPENRFTAEDLKKLIAVSANVQIY